jgi:hypothetical protein
MGFLDEINGTPVMNEKSAQDQLESIFSGSTWVDVIKKINLFLV